MFSNYSSEELGYNLESWIMWSFEAFQNKQMNHIYRAEVIIPPGVWSFAALQNIHHWRRTYSQNIHRWTKYGAEVIIPAGVWSAISVRLSPQLSVNNKCGKHCKPCVHFRIRSIQVETVETVHQLQLNRQNTINKIKIFVCTKRIFSQREYLSSISSSHWLSNCTFCFLICYCLSIKYCIHKFLTTT